MERDGAGFDVDGLMSVKELEVSATEVSTVITLPKNSNPLKDHDKSGFTLALLTPVQQIRK
jgi:hypothetical protein